jgi:hypothetical protein
VHSTELSDIAPLLRGGDLVLTTGIALPDTAAELEAFALEVAEELLARRIKLLVVACNSATAAALPALRE